MKSLIKRFLISTVFFLLYSSVFAIPPGALVVDVNDASNKLEVDSAIWNALLRRGGGGEIMREWEALRRLKSFQRRLPPAFDRLVYLRERGKLLLPKATRGELTFRYEGWTSDEETKLRGFVQILYPQIKQVYGDPAWGGVVTIKKDTSLSDLQVVLAGVYDVSTATIRMEWGRAGDVETAYRLLHLMLHAFHGPHQIGFDAWEEGMTWAATRVIFSLAFPQEDFPYYCTFYLLQIYDLLNQPALASPTFWPQSFQGMTIWRHAQALSAWLKIYIENPFFFSAFNSLYYQRVVIDPSTSSDEEKLKSLCAQVVPWVENLPFDEWYSQQYIFQTQPQYGPNLYVWNMPDVPDNPDTEGFGLYMILVYFRAEAGDEFPLNGQVMPRYWNYDFSIDLPVEPQYEIVDIQDGLGFVAPKFFNIGGSQRVTIEFSLGGVSVSIPFPYGVTGSTADPKEVYGVLKEGLDGDFSINGTNVPLTKGVFGVDYPITGWQKMDIVFTSPEGKTVQRRVNFGDKGYAVVISTPREKTKVSKVFSKGLYMISPPLEPASHDASSALSIPPDRLLLARWDPLKEGTNKYRLYPDVGFSLGNGYFLRLLEDRNIELEGYARALDSEFSISLSRGWNQIGYPFTEGGCPLGNLMVKIPGEPQPVSFAEANKRGYISRTLWRFNPQKGEYEELDPLQGVLQPWEGYWLKCFKECWLIVPGPNKGRKMVSRSTPSQEGWVAKLRIFSQGKEVSLLFGQMRGASLSSDIYDLEFPPPFASSPLAAFVGESGLLAWDMKPFLSPSQWLLRIATKGECVISWPDLSAFPRGFSLFLTDLSNGNKVSLLHSASYKFEGDGGPREFLIAMKRKNPLLISNLLVNSTRGKVSFSFSLSREAETRAIISSLNGNKLRVIYSRGTREGINIISWDGRDEQGRLVPGGIYLLEIEANSEGEKVRSIRTFILR